jgi:hypothetical protein
MADENAEKMFQLAAEDGQAAFRKRVEKEKRTQERSRKIRRALRWTFYTSGAVMFGSLLARIYVTDSDVVGAMIFIGAFIAFVAMVPLFFMGGIAPSFVRRRLSEREQRMLDD